MVRMKAVFCLGALLLASASHAQEWTRFRGPNGSGIGKATNLPVAYSPETANWRIELPGAGHSSPVIWGNKLYVTAADSTGGKRHLLCINTADGKPFWTRTYDYSAYNHHRLHNPAAGTAAVDADAVYFTWIVPDSHLILALDHSGKELWRRDLGKYLSQHGGSSTPIVLGDQVIIRSDSDEEGPESYITALDRKTGAVKWKLGRQAKAASYSTPVLYEPKDGPAQLIFSSQAHGITSIDPTTGKVNWEGVPFRQRTVSTPVIAGDLIFATVGNGGGERQGVAVQVPAAGAPLKTAYQISRGVPYVPTPLVLGDKMYLWGDAGIVTCVNAATGETIWSERVGGNFYGSPICADGKLIAMSAQGELVVLEAGDQFKLLGKSPLGELSHSTPAVAGGVLYLRTEKHLISLGGKK